MWVIKLKNGIEINNISELSYSEPENSLRYRTIYGVSVEMKLSQCNVIKHKDGDIIYENKNKPMKKVIRLDEPKEEKKPIELTHYHSSIGWEDSSYSIYRIVKKSEKIIYLGRCDKDKDMFAVYTKDGFITICRGHLNDGVY